MSTIPQPPLSLIRREVVDHLEEPVAELLDRALGCLMRALDARAAFVATVEDRTLEVIAARVDGGPAIEPGLRLALEETFLAADEECENGVINVRDAARRQPFKSLPMRQRLGIVSFLGTPLYEGSGELTATVAVLGKGARVLSETDQDLLVIVAGLLASRLRSAASGTSGQLRTPVSAVRLASQEVKEPLAILRGYADMLSNNEVPADQMPLVARRLAMQSETLMRIADQVLLLSRLPLELAFTVRVSLGAIAQSAGQRIRERLSNAGMELRLQLD